MNRLSILLVCVWAVLAVHAQTYNVRDRWGTEGCLVQSVTERNGKAIVGGCFTQSIAPYFPIYQTILVEGGNHFNSYVSGEMSSSKDVLLYKLINFNDTLMLGVGGIREYYACPYVSFLDSNFKSKFFIEYKDTTKESWSLDVVKFDESSALILKYFSPIGSPILQTAITKITSHGSICWEKNYPQIGNGMIFPNCIKRYMKGYVFAGTFRYYSITPSTYVAPKFTFIDTAGNIEKEWLLGQDIEGVKGMVANDTDSSIIYCSNKFVSSNPAPKYNPYLSKLDGNGNVKWEKLIGVPFYETPLQTVIRLKDGNYITVGTAPHDFNDNGVNQPYMAGWIVKFADMGDSAHVLWERKYRGANSGNSVNILHDIVEKANGNLVAVGESTQSDSLYPQQGWILGLDSFGCLVPGCQDWTAINDKVIETTTLLRLYPNPMQDALYFDVQGVEEKRSFQMQITDISGREFLQTMVSPQVQYSIDTKVYSTGSYIITLTENGKVVEKRKVVKQ